MAVNRYFAGFQPINFNVAAYTPRLHTPDPSMLADYMKTVQGESDALAQQVASTVTQPSPFKSEAYDAFQKDLMDARDYVYNEMQNDLNKGRQALYDLSHRLERTAKPGGRMYQFKQDREIYDKAVEDIKERNSNDPVGQAYAMMMFASQNEGPQMDSEGNLIPTRYTPVADIPDDEAIMKFNEYILKNMKASQIPVRYRKDGSPVYFSEAVNQLSGATDILRMLSAYGREGRKIYSAALNSMGPEMRRGFQRLFNQQAWAGAFGDSVAFDKTTGTPYDMELFKQVYDLAVEKTGATDPEASQLAMEMSKYLVNDPARLYQMEAVWDDDENIIKLQPVNQTDKDGNPIENKYVYDGRNPVHMAAMGVAELGEYQRLTRSDKVFTNYARKKMIEDGMGGGPPVVVTGAWKPVITDDGKVALADGQGGIVEVDPKEKVKFLELRKEKADAMQEELISREVNRYLQTGVYYYNYDNPVWNPKPQKSLAFDDLPDQLLKDNEGKSRAWAEAEAKRLIKAQADDYAKQMYTSWFYNSGIAVMSFFDTLFNGEYGKSSPLTEGQQRVKEYYQQQGVVFDGTPKKQRKKLMELLEAEMMKPRPSSYVLRPDPTFQGYFKLPGGLGAFSNMKAIWKDDKGGSVMGTVREFLEDKYPGGRFEGGRGTNDPMKIVSNSGKVADIVSVSMPIADPFSPDFGYRMFSLSDQDQFKVAPDSGFIANNHDAWMIHKYALIQPGGPDAAMGALLEFSHDFKGGDNKDYNIMYDVQTGQTILTDKSEGKKYVMEVTQNDQGQFGYQLDELADQ